MTVQQLPYEILEYIFRIVKLAPNRSNDMTNCAMVCQAWYLPACRVLFKKLQFKSIMHVVKGLKTQRSNLGVYCKVLHFGKTRTGNERPSVAYEQLFTYLPNIHTIILKRSHVRSYHLEQIAQHAKHIKHVKGVLLEGNWRPEEIQSYYRCVTAYKSTLQHMTLSSIGETISTVDGRFGNMIDFLPDFTALTTLDITNKLYSYAANLPRLSMFHVMRLCPSLIRFTLTNSFQEPEDNNIDYTFDHSKLEYLELSLPRITTYQINYLAANVIRLNEFKLEFEPTSITSVPILWMERLGPDTLDLFQRYLAAISTFDFNMKGNFESNLIEYWPYISRIIAGNRPTPAHIRLEVNNDERHYSGKTTLRKYKDTIYINCKMSLTTFQSIAESSISPILLQTIIASPELRENNVQTFYIDFNADCREDFLREHCLRIFELVTSTFEALNYFGMNIDFSLGQDMNIRT